MRLNAYVVSFFLLCWYFGYGAGILLGGVMAGEKLAWIFAGLVVVGVLLVAVFLFCRVKMLRNMLSCGSDDDYDDDDYDEYEDYDSD